MMMTMTGVKLPTRMTALLRMMIVLLFVTYKTIAVSSDYSNSSSTTSEKLVLEENEYPFLYVNTTDTMVKDNKDETSLQLFSYHRMTTHTKPGECVTTQRGFLHAIYWSNPRSAIEPTTINLCTKYLKIDASSFSTSDIGRGIFVSNAHIQFNCILPNPNEKCIIDAQRKSRHFYIEDSIVSFHRFIFINGIGTPDTASVYSGGSLSIFYSSIVQIDNCHFINNIAPDYGNGGAITTAFDCIVQMENVNMRNNKASSGGAIDSFLSNIIMTNVTFTKNRAKWYGGAVGSYQSNVSMLNAVFIDNKISWIGGAVSVKETNIIMTNVSIANHKAKIGGAINCETCTLTMTNVVLTDNKAKNLGGAVYSTNAAIKMTDVILTNNVATDDGGAIYSETCSIIITNASLTNNTVKRDGGAVFVSWLSNFIMTNASLTNNSALDGGAVFIDASSNITATNTLFTTNNAKNGGAAIFSNENNVKLSNVLLTNNRAENGTINMGNTAISFDKVSFVRSPDDIDSTDIFVYVPDYDGQYVVSKLNFRPTPPPRMMQRQSKQVVNDTIVLRSSRDQLLLQPCVTKFSMLRKQVNLCHNTLDAIPCQINICSLLINTTGIDNYSSAIPIINKVIVINCELEDFKRCTIDGQGISRIFHVSNASVTFRNIIFANGSSAEGGSLFIKKKSVVNMLNCSFVNNSAANGGAVSVQNSKLMIAGTQSSFINNTGGGSPLKSYSSELNIIDTIFDGNNMTNFGNGIFVFDSRVNFYNLTFPETAQNRGIVGLDCNVFVAINPIDPMELGSCLDLGNTIEST